MRVLILLILALWLNTGCKSRKTLSAQISQIDTPPENAEVKHITFSGKHHSHRKQKDIEKKSDFDLKQAQLIINERIENRDKHEKHANNRKETMHKILHALNFKSKAERKRLRISYEFY